MELTANYKLCTNLIFNWEVSPLDDVPASFVPFGINPKICATLSSKMLSVLLEIQTFQMSLQFGYPSTRKALRMQDCFHFSIFFSVILMKFINKCGRVGFKLVDSQHELLLNYLLFCCVWFFVFFFTPLSDLYFVLNLGLFFDNMES